MVNKKVNTYRVSVRALVEHLLRRGDLSMNFDLSPANVLRARNWVHQRIQKSRRKPYETEVPVSFRLESNRFILDVHGRIDGLYERRGSIVVEEIKTTYRELDDFIRENNPLHWAQVKVYAALYAREKSLDRILTQLTYCHSETGEIRTDFQEYASEDLWLFFLGLTGKYTAWLERIQARLEERNLSIAGSRFPFSSFRPGQREMMEEVSTAIQREGRIIIQAPTGIGKTVAVLFPAVENLASGQIEKIFYLTSRTTGRLIAEKTLMRLNKAGMMIKFVTLTSKEKICFNPEKNCTGEDCAYAKGFYDRLDKARYFFFAEDFFTADKISEISSDFQICPFEFSLDLARWADVVIGDINYAFDPRVYLKRFFFEDPPECTFLIDEAHNLVDRSREMFSARIEKKDFLRLRRLLKNKESEAFNVAGKVNSRFLELKQAMGDLRRTWEKEIPEGITAQLRGLTHSIERWQPASLGASFSQKVLDLYFAANWFLKVSDLYGENYITCLERDENNLKVKLFCVDPSDQLGEAFQRCSSAVLFSATITPMSYFARIFGLEETADKKSFPSPFPTENLCLMVASSISTLYKHRNHTKQDLVRKIGALVESKKGNYMVYFPSYEYLKMVYPHYKKAFPHHHVLLQTPDMKEVERIQFLSQFSEENSRAMVGFVVMGGIFGEGIDLKGERLSGAAIVGVGLPGLSLEREIIRFHYTENQFPGYDFAYRYPGLIRVFQAAGRVIRTENDRGAILLLDNRYRGPFYSSLFPQEWQVRWVNDAGDIDQILKSFWSGKGQ